MRSLWNGKREDKGMLYSWNFKEMAGIMIFENCHFAVIRFDFVKKRKKAATAPKKGDTTHEPSVVILAICEWSYYPLNMYTNFPNFIISTNYTGTLNTLACFPNFKWLSQELQPTVTQWRWCGLVSRFDLKSLCIFLYQCCCFALIWIWISPRQE